MGPYDALVEIWNGVPWFSPLWARRPNLTFIHHVHGPMWDQVMPGPLAPAGRFLEARFAPPFYRRGLTVTPSDACFTSVSGDRRAPSGRRAVTTRDSLPASGVAMDASVTVSVTALVPIPVPPPKRSPMISSRARWIAG